MKAHQTNWKFHLPESVLNQIEQAYAKAHRTKKQKDAYLEAYQTKLNQMLKILLHFTYHYA